jgi:DNA-binding LacI/PurR family transcriptional regulator
VLSGQDRVVSQERAQRVLAVAAKLQYQPNTAARSLRARTSNLVGVLIAGEPNPFASDVLAGIDDFLQGHHHALVLAHAPSERGRERVCIERFIAQGVRGVIAFNPSPSDGMPSFPIVTVQGERAPAHGDNVGVNDLLGAQLAIRHLLKQGHGRIAVVAGPASMSNTSPRLQGCLAALKSEGISLHEHLIEHVAPDHAGGYQAAARLEALPPSQRPTALFVLHDAMVLGALHLLHERRIEVPRELAVVSFGDLPYMAELSPPLTTVALSAFEMGSAAARLLFERAQTPERPSTDLRLAPQLIVRASCGARTPGPQTLESSIYHSAVVLPGTKSR